MDMKSLQKRKKSRKLRKMNNEETEKVSETKTSTLENRGSDILEKILETLSSNSNIRSTKDQMQDIEDGESNDVGHSNNICQITFKTKTLLFDQRTNYHGKNRFSCDQCRKTFGHAGNLQRHKKIHSGIKPYKCDLCDLSFTQMAHLKTHQQRRHT